MKATISLKNSSMTVHSWYLTTMLTSEQLEGGWLENSFQQRYLITKQFLTLSHSTSKLWRSLDLEISVEWSQLLLIWRQILWELFTSLVDMKQLLMQKHFVDFQLQKKLAVRFFDWMLFEKVFDITEPAEMQSDRRSKSVNSTLRVKPNYRPG